MKYFLISITTVFLLALGVYALSSAVLEHDAVDRKIYALDDPKLLEPQRRSATKPYAITQCPYFSDIREGYETERWGVSISGKAIRNMDELEELISDSRYLWKKTYKNHQQPYLETKLEFSGIECHYEKRWHIKGKPDNHFGVSRIVVIYGPQFGIFLDLELQAKQWQTPFVSHSTGAHVVCWESRTACWFQTVYHEKDSWPPSLTQAASHNRQCGKLADRMAKVRR